jgi:hypothetical protein
LLQRVRLVMLLPCFVRVAQLPCNKGSNDKWNVDLLKKIFATGKIKSNTLVLPNGIGGVKDALKSMQEGKVRCKVRVRATLGPASPTHPTASVSPSPKQAHRRLSIPRFPFLS